MAAADLGTAAHNAMGGAAEGATKAALELAKIVFGWIVPLITLAIGFFIGGSIGLSGLIANLLDGVMPASVSAQTIAIVSDLVAIAIWGAIAVGLWSIGGHLGNSGEGDKSKSTWASYIVRPFATLFGGFAASEVPALFKTGGGVNNGVLSTVAAGGAATAAAGAKA